MYAILHSITPMSIFDKLPLDLTDVIYKKSLKEHFENLHKNVVKFHLKCAQRRLTYSNVRFRKWKPFAAEMRRLFILIEEAKLEDTTWHGIQNKIYYTYVACKLAQYNERFLKRNGGLDGLMVLEISYDSMNEIYNVMDLC